MNSWLQKAMEWGQAAIDEKSIEVDNPSGVRAELFVAVEESLQSKEAPREIKLDGIANHAPLICLSLSGGLDSVVAYEVAKLTTRAEVRAYYVKLNTPYANDELDVLERKLKLDFSVIDLSTWPQRWEPYTTGWQHILPVRNLVIVTAIAGMTDDRPADIWIGATDGEIPLKGGDKSRRFFDAADNVLNTFPLKHTLKFPLAKQTKTDLVRWWLKTGLPVEKLLGTLTCQSPIREFGEASHCGSCHACFNRWVAFSNCGLEEPMRVVPISVEANMLKIAAMKTALRDHDFVLWSERRILQTLEAWERANKKLAASVGP